MRTAAGLDADQARWLHREESNNLASSQLSPKHGPPSLVGSVYLKYLLGNVQPNSCYSLHGRSSSWRAYQLTSTRRVHPIRSLLGVIVIFVVFKENTFTAQTVEVEAGQTVVSTGPYALVRHSMYVGGLVFMLGIPPALGSWWGMLMILLFTPAIAWRILSEEKLLVRDLPGYLEYCNKVRYRLVPLVW